MGAFRIESAKCFDKQTVFDDICVDIKIYAFLVRFMSFRMDLCVFLAGYA